MGKSTKDSDFIGALQAQAATASAAEGKAKTFKVAKLHMTQATPSTGKSFDEMLAENEAKNHTASDTSGTNDIDNPTSGDKVVEIETNCIAPSPYQPRIKIDEDVLRELAESIQANGLYVPITVRPPIDGKYELVCGERRWRAHLLLGKQTISAVVKTITDAEAEIQALAENEAREDLTDFERALRYRSMLDRKIASSQVDLARRIGRERKFVDRCLSMLRLPDEVITMLKDRPEFITARAASDFAAFTEKDVDLVIEACRKVYYSDLDSTNALNWLKGQSRARHSITQEKTIREWRFNGRHIGQIKKDGRKLIISCAEGVSADEIMDLIFSDTFNSAPIGADKKEHSST